MSSELEATTQPATIVWPVLTPHERRVLGVLVEKAKTTPDVYPLSLNSLVTGSNQKSNRDPIMNFSDVDVEEALDSAQKKGLTVKITGGRVERWRHVLYETWQVGKVELAILAELLLRGPQTEGELRSRASRMEPITDLDSLRSVLIPLAERRLVVYLTPEGRRGTVLTHGFHSPEEIEKLRAQQGSFDHDAPVTDRTSSSVVSHSDATSLHERLANLERAMAELTEQVRQLKERLGT
jgi:uncharacterized protein YceH (UPF0502 family)